jgi:hypothetical protein
MCSNLLKHLALLSNTSLGYKYMGVTNTLAYSNSVLCQDYYTTAQVAVKN